MERPSYTKATVTSRDGTTIGYRQMGTGPGVILVHGGMEASQHFMKRSAWRSPTASQSTSSIAVVAA